MTPNLSAPPTYQNQENGGTHFSDLGCAVKLFSLFHPLALQGPWKPVGCFPFLSKLWKGSGEDREQPQCGLWTYLSVRGCRVWGTTVTTFWSFPIYMLVNSRTRERGEETMFVASIRFQGC